MEHLLCTRYCFWFSHFPHSKSLNASYKVAALNGVRFTDEDQKGEFTCPKSESNK